MRFVTLFALTLTLFFPAMAVAQMWPADADWEPLLRNGLPIDDIEGDVVGSRDIVGDATDAAAFTYSDATFLYFRLRVDDDPRQGMALQPFAWGVEFETDGNLDNFEGLVMVNGIANPEIVSLQQNTVQGSIGDPSDQAEVEIANYPVTTHARVVTAATMFGGHPDYFIDFAVPWSDLAMIGIVPGQPFGIILGSGNSANVFAADIGTSIAAEVSDPVTCDANGCSGILSVTITAPVAGSTVTDSTPTISGTTEPGATVDVVFNAGTANEQTVTVTADAQGNWSATPSMALPDGRNRVDVTATDGNRVGTAAVSFGVDATPPTVTIDQPADGSATSDTTPTVSGTTEPNAEVTLVFDAGTPDETTVVVTANGSGVWTYIPTTDLAEGSHTVDASSTDAAGNTGTASAGFEVDTTAPALDITQPAEGSETSDRRPTISGTSDPNQVVVLVINAGTANERTVNVTADANGNWTFTPTNDLPTGANTIDATATDAAGNQTIDSVSFTVSASADVAINTPGDGTATNDTTPDVTGTGEPGQTVSIVIDAGTPTEETATVTVEPDGSWSYTPMTALVEGEHTVDVSQTGSGGMMSSDTVTFEVDTTPPSVRITDPADATTTGDSTPAIEGSTDEAGAVVTLVIDAGTPDETTVTVTADANGNWSYSPADPLADGTHTVDATVTDPAGNSDTDSVTFDVDSNLPFITINQPTDESLTSNSSPTITGRADPGAEVTIVIDEGTPDERTATVTADAAGNWSYTPDMPLDDGKHRVTASVTAPDGGVGTDAVDFEVDTTAPTVTVTGPQDGATINDAAPTVTGTTEPGATVVVTVNGQTYTTTADDTGNWSVDVDPLPDGDYTITVQATDRAGNTGAEGSSTFTVDTSGPSVSITSPGAGEEVGDRPTITGTADPGATVEVYVEGVLVGTTTADANGNWSFEIPEDDALAPGDHTIEVVARDDGGNEATATVQITVPGGTPGDGDGDGVPDDEEAQYGTDPSNPDTDQDGLTDGEEINDWGTNPIDPDTDDDGLTDGEEIDLGTNPGSGDTDGDGLGDADEVDRGTDPRDPDTDGGGVPDGVEVDNGTDPNDEADDRSSAFLLSGGGCSTAPTSPNAVWLLVLLLAAFRGWRMGYGRERPHDMRTAGNR